MNSFPGFYDNLSSLVMRNNFSFFDGERGSVQFIVLSMEGHILQK